MNHIFKNIKLKLINRIILILYISLYFSNLSAEDFLETLQSQNDELLLQKVSLSVSKKNNFKNYSPSERIIYLYLNDILDRLLSSNEDILRQYHKKISDFSIKLSATTDNKSTSFTSSGLGIINLKIGYNYFFKGSYITEDSYIAASLSHEIAHEILDHYSEQQDLLISLYNEFIFMDNQEGTLFSEYYKKHPSFISLHKRQEIDADNLGLLIYLNAGFKPESFRNRFMETQPSYTKQSYPSVSEERLNFFNILSENQNYIREGNLAIKNKTFKEFMKEIKYIHPNDYHPSQIWRYWNAYKKEEYYRKHHYINNNNNNNNTSVTNTTYIKIDLSKSSRIKELVKFLNKSDFYKIPIHPDDIKILILGLILDLKNINQLNDSDIKQLLLDLGYDSTLLDSYEIADPRVYIIHELLTSNSQISFSMDSTMNDRNDIIRIKNDNTMILKANNIFKIMIMVNKFLLKFKSLSCSDLFIGTDKMFNSLVENLNTTIKDSFENHAREAALLSLLFGLD